MEPSIKQFVVYLALSFFVVINAEHVWSTFAVMCYTQSGRGECVLNSRCRNQLEIKYRPAFTNVFGKCDFPNVCCNPSNIQTAISQFFEIMQTTVATPNFYENIESSTATPIVKSAFQPKGKCGVRNINGVIPTTKNVNINEAKFGEFPWMVAILGEYKCSDSGKKKFRYICGGSLIHPKVVLIAAHCLRRWKSPKMLKIRAGEYDTTLKSEPLPHQVKYVSDIVIHQDFNSVNLHNDIALLILKKPVKLTPNVGIVCLPPQSNITKPANCIATGWGKNRFGKIGRSPKISILKKINLPIIENAKCEIELKKTRLGNKFLLHRSFMCAGGSPNVDTCTGDGGSPLVCPMTDRADGYEQIGIVAWGIGCGNAIPGVYVNVPYFRKWIDEKLKLFNL